jgi:UPF0755 protein
MKRIYITVAILLVIIGITAVWWINGTSPANPKNNTAKIFIVEKGQGLKAISKNLKDQGLIKDSVAFFLLTREMGLDSKIQAGDFRLFPSMSAKQIANELTHGTLDVWITVPEGQRADEIAKTLKEKMPNYDPSWDKVLEENEGYLFPDTYLLPREADINTIVSIMRNNFDTKYKTLDTSKTDLTQDQIVTLASLIEREARVDTDRPLVSSVIHNRLEQGMKLDIDASIQYALGNKQNWWPTLTDTGGNVLPDSPFNTYTHAGLPPTPISNPGLESLQAAVNPNTTVYLYYFTDGNGTTHFAKTLEEQQANISKYGL